MVWKRHMLIYAVISVSSIISLWSAMCYPALLTSIPFRSWEMIPYKHNTHSPLLH